MAQEVGYLELLSNQILNLFNMLLEIEKIGKELLDHFGLQELMLVLELRSILLSFNKWFK